MIVGIGTDLIAIERIRQAIERNPKFKHKIYTPAEQAYCEQAQDPMGRYAARFAAKEAVAKALGTGIGKIGWLDVEITKLASGAPALQLSGAARQLQHQLGINHLHLSMSHCQQQAVAYVVLEQ